MHFTLKERISSVISKSIQSLAIPIIGTGCYLKILTTRTLSLLYFVTFVTSPLLFITYASFLLRGRWTNFLAALTAGLIIGEFYPVLIEWFMTSPNYKLVFAYNAIDLFITPLTLLKVYSSRSEASRKVKTQ